MDERIFHARARRRSLLQIDPKTVRRLLCGEAARAAGPAAGTGAFSAAALRAHIEGKHKDEGQ